jgi:GNAT superfamily N-acetyltransferase
MSPGTIEIASLTGQETRTCSAGLAGILIACVHSGASVSFMAPLALEKALSFWHDVAGALDRGERLLLVARDRSAGQLLGTVQVHLKQPENQPHRGDVAKMLVRPEARRQGIGSQLMLAAEDAARAAGKTLLVLDTATGGDAERLYTRLGWTPVGTIPGYALLPDGQLNGTTILYKRI